MRKLKIAALLILGWASITPTLAFWGRKQEAKEKVDEEKPNDAKDPTTATLEVMKTKESMEGECNSNTKGVCSEEDKGGSSSAMTSSTENEDSSQCRLYLAESSIPGAGWGIYTGVNLTAKSKIEPYSLALQVIDLVDKRWALRDSWWEPSLTWSTYLAKDVRTIFPGVGMLANSFPNLDNADSKGCRSHKPRFGHQAGAVSECQEAYFATLKGMPAGHELLIDYGDNWFLRHTDLPNDLVPLADHYQHTDTLLQEWEYEVSGDLDSDEAKAAYQQLRRSAGPVIRKTLPVFHEDAVQVVYETLADEPLSSAHVHLGLDRLVRTPEWLEENGACIDGMNVRNLTDGYGAFARQPFAKDEVVSGVPVLQLSVDQMKMKRGPGQILLNYCFGHEESSLLLLPMSPATPQIRHSDNPNVALRWWSSPNGPPHSNEEWKELSVQEILREDGGHLLLELYALRDIELDEEILLDYGPDWRAAWNEYQEAHDPVPETNITSWHYNRFDEIYTKLETDLYPPEDLIQVRCFVERDELKPPEDPVENHWYEWRPTVEKTDSLDDTEPCTVLTANLKDFQKSTYRVVLEADGLHVDKVPWHAILFIAKPYTGNLFRKDAFRHSIELPDDIFPQKWRDIKNRLNQAATKQSSRSMSSSHEAESASSWNDGDSSCGLYMAESSIPNAGLGMFTAKPISIDERIFYGDIVCNVEDFGGNMKLRKRYLNRKDKKKPYWLMDNYYWMPSAAIAFFEADDVGSVIPGLGMLANSHPGLVNAQQMPPQRVADLKRSVSPGAGAATNYHDVHFAAEENIQAGEEIFVEYGDKWFDLRKEEIGLIPLSKNWRQADRLIQKYGKIFGGDFDSEVARETLELLQMAVAPQERVKIALPSDVTEASTAYRESSAKASLPGRVKSREFLEQNGVCLDNIRPAMSTLPDAGRGAFLTRDLLQGSVIAPLPVVQLRRYHMEVYDTRKVKDSSNGEKREEVFYLRKQLLMNYCYGHPGSSILLFPYSPVVNYINHNQTLKNAEIRWSEHTHHREDWLERSPSDLEVEDHAGMIMEVVATRDVKEGEEVFIDYGDEWEAAWLEHVADWTPAHNGRPSAAEMNALHQSIPTQEQIEDDALYEDFLFGCVIGFPDDDELKDPEAEKVTIYWESPERDYEDGDDVFECTVLQKYEGQEIYDVEVEIKDRMWVVKEIPRSAIQYFDTPYSSEMFDRRAFRHELGLPDSMIPDAWYDLPTSPKSSP